MGIREQRVPQYLSLAATASSLLVVGWLWSRGQDNPIRYTSSMEVNHHRGYGKVIACNECHVPTGGMFSLTQDMNCTTAQCHGELHVDTPDHQKIELAQEYPRYNRPDTPENAVSLYLQYHDEWKMEGRECWECHKEHDPQEPLDLDDFIAWQKETGRPSDQAYSSIYETKSTAGDNDV